MSAANIWASAANGTNPTEFSGRIMDERDMPQRPLILLEERQASGTNGGDFVSGAWRTRQVNTVIADPYSFLESLSDGVFTIKAGIWLIRAWATALYVSGSQLKLFDVTNNADALNYPTSNKIVSSSEFSPGGGQSITASKAVLTGRLVLTQSTAFKLLHQCETTCNGSGMGLACSFGEPNVYAGVELVKIGNL